MIEKILGRVALYARQHHDRVFVILAVLLLISGALMFRLRFDTEILNLLPQDDPVVKTFRHTLEEFGSLDFFLVVVRLPEGAVLDPYLDFADRLGTRLEQLDELQYLDYRIGDIEQLIAEFFPQAFLFLDDEGRAQVESRLTEPAIERRVAEIRRRLATPQSLVVQDLQLLDPLGVSEVFLDRLAITQGALKVDWSSGYFLSKDRSVLLMIGRPTEPAQEVEFGRRLIAQVDRVVADVVAEWPEIVGTPEAAGLGPVPPPPQVDLGGTYVIAAEDAGYVFRDIMTNAVTSMVGVLVLFLLAFRRLGLALYALVPLTAGLIFAFAFAAVTVGTLNAATTGFAALLVGLGIDFVIVSYGRYVEERNKGRTLSEALVQMSGSSGRAVVTGGVTTAATFYAFGVTEFTGLRQLGFLVGTGILFCMVSVLVVLPAMLAWREDHRRGFLRRIFVRGDRKPVLFLQGFGTGKLIALCLRRPVPVLVCGALVTAICGLFALRLEFVDSIRSMRPEGNRGMLIQDEIAERFGSGFDYMMLVISADSEEELLARTSEAAERFQPMVESGELNGIDSVGSLLPSPQRQRAALAWLAEQRQSGLLPGRVESLFGAAAVREGMRPEAFAEGFALLEQAAAADQQIGVGSFAGSVETRRLLDRYVRHTSDGWRAVVYLHPPPRVWKRQAPPEVVRLADELGPHAVLSGVNLVSERLRTQVKSDALVAAAVGMVLVALLLWIDYRRLRDSLLSLAPLMVGIVWMLGGMAVLGIAMNFFNVFVTTMIIGIGVDYGVHMMHRFRESSAGGDLLAGLQETGKAIVLAALSTSVGFGSMSLSRYPGLRSMGMVAIMGALATALVAVTLLPAFLGLRQRRAERKGS